MLLLNDLYYDKMKKIVRRHSQEEKIEIAIFYKKQNVLFYNCKKHIYKGSVRQCTKSVGHRVLAKWPRRKNELKDKKNRF